MPLMPTPEKVATPATALTVAVPTVVPLPLTDMVTAAVLLVTVLPKASLIVITGCVVNAEPLALPAAEVPSVNWVAAPATTVATCTGLPLLDPLLVTTAVKLPTDGGVFNVTVNWVAVALVTVPVPLLRVTVLFPAVVSKPEPVMISVVAVAARLLVLEVTVGPELKVAVCPVKARLFKSTLVLAEP